MCNVLELSTLSSVRTIPRINRHTYFPNISYCVIKLVDKHFANTKQWMFYTKESFLDLLCFWDKVVNSDYTVITIRFFVELSSKGSLICLWFLSVIAPLIFLEFSWNLLFFVHLLGRKFMDHLHQDVLVVAVLSYWVHYSSCSHC